MSDNIVPPPGSEQPEQPAELWVGEEPAAAEDPAAFVGRVRRKIHRRTAATQAVTFSWTAPALVLLGMIGVATAFLASFGQGRKDS